MPSNLGTLLCSLTARVWRERGNFALACWRLSQILNYKNAFYFACWHWTASIQRHILPNLRGHPVSERAHVQSATPKLSRCRVALRKRGAAGAPIKQTGQERRNGCLRCLERSPGWEMAIDFHPHPWKKKKKTSRMRAFSSSNYAKPVDTKAIGFSRSKIYSKVKS